MEDELTQNGESYDVMKMAIGSSISLFEVSHHFLFFGIFNVYSEKPVNNQFQFYRDTLQSTVAKGVIITVTHDTNLTQFGTQLVCIVCEENLKDLDVRRTSPAQLLLQLQLTRHSQYMQRFVQLAEWPGTKLIVEKICDFTNPNFCPTFAHKYPLYCLYQVLLSSFNMTLKPGRERRNMSKLSISSVGYTTLYEEVYQMSIQNGLAIVTTPFPKFPLKFTTFQPKPKFTAPVLLKPYDWKSWITALTTIILLSLVLSIQTFATCGGLLDSLFSLVSITLNQSCNIQTLGAIKSNILVIWLTAMVVLSEAYKEMVLILDKTNKVVVAREFGGIG